MIDSISDVLKGLALSAASLASSYFATVLHKVAIEGFETACGPSSAG